ncbi:MAG TPA: hypothetical protein G4O00_09340 [Thermoflexia bacterium]|nr:hypothetical protein [Thermoflexia bacterium]
MAEARGRGDSFILRIWWEEEKQRWRGWVQHAGTGQMTYVQNLEELMAFIQRFTGDLVPTPWSHQD